MRVSTRYINSSLISLDVVLFVVNAPGRLISWMLHRGYCMDALESHCCCQNFYLSLQNFHYELNWVSVHRITFRFTYKHSGYGPLKPFSRCIQGYKDIYSPVTFKCTQEFVLVTFHTYSALTNRQNITISHV